MYCDQGISDTIVEINKVLNGDTIVKTYKHKRLAEQTFSYYFYNDSIFSKYQNDYYLIGANQAEIGDIWQPIWYDLASYSEIASSNCSIVRTLKVIDKEIVNMGVQNRMKYTLKIMDIDFGEFPYYQEVYFSFIEGIGAIDGGPYYNLTSSANCTDCFDCYQSVFISYQNGSEGYNGESICKPLSIYSLPEKENIMYKIIDNTLFVNEIEENDGLIIYNLMGETIRESSQDNINISGLSGMYLLKIKTQTDKYYTSKIIVQ